MKLDGCLRPVLFRMGLRHGLMLAMGWVLCVFSAVAQDLSRPARRVDAETGTTFSRRISTLDFTNREQAMLDEVLAGNVPGFYRKFCAVSITNRLDGNQHAATFFAAPDYLAVGSDEDYFFVPMSPVVAQRIADRLNCSLPTRKMVNDIYAAAAVKLTPSPIPPGPRMITVPVFAEHNGIVRSQRLDQVAMYPLGHLVAGDKKDIVITARLTNSPGRVAIYGWHQTNGVPIQPLYLGHTDAWADYSHGVRLISNKVIVDGRQTTMATVLADPQLAGLLSDEGVVTTPRYATNALPKYPAGMIDALAKEKANPSLGAGERFSTNAHFGERDIVFGFDPEVRVRLNLPHPWPTNKTVELILYALPNGNTIEQSVGRQLQPGDDWHFNIQHIGAQTRFLRNLISDRAVVVAYLEAATKSWPQWRKNYGDARIPAIVQAVKQRLPNAPMRMVLTGHSGGGSFTFGYLNEVKSIPPEVERIAFLDSNYAYNRSNHLAKLLAWLKSPRGGRMCVLAYDDANALLDGKPFVTAAGGTWGKSHAMLADLGERFEFERTMRGEIEVQSAAKGRIQFLLKANSEQKIYHTIQVERNGFIHAMLTGTPLEGKGYEYFGDRAYERWIESD